MVSRSFLPALAVAASTILVSASISNAREEAPAAPGAAVVKRLQPVQYQNIISDVFGKDIDASGNFEPLPRQDGLLALGAASSSITPTGFKQFDAMAQNVSRRVVDEQHREALIPCKPASPKM